MRSNLPKVGSPDTASDHLTRARSFLRVKYSILRNVGDELFSPYGIVVLILLIFCLIPRYAVWPVLSTGLLD